MPQPSQVRHSERSEESKPTAAKWAIAGLICLLAPLALAQTTHPLAPDEIDQAYLRDHFDKHEYPIPMRDGVHLHTAVYTPKDASASPRPILLLRTPYGVGGYGAGNFPDPKYELRWFAHQNFIFAYQDVRGRNHSEGTFLHVRPLTDGKGVDESTDTYDTVDYLVKNLPANNGRVALTGLSYPGMYALEGAINAHPAVKCAIPQAPVIDWFEGDDIHHNGAFCLAQSYPYLASVGGHPIPPGTPDAYPFYLHMGPVGSVTALDGVNGFWDEVMAHPNYDAYWQARNVRPHLVAANRVPILMVGGWFDAEDLFGTLAGFRELARHNPNTSLVMGPWSHGAWMRSAGSSLGDVQFNAKTAEHFRNDIELPFLKSHLESDAPTQPPAATLFETGTNQWHTYDTWPPRDSVEKSLYLCANGAISFNHPPATDAPFDEYLSDPAHPVPYDGLIGMGVSVDFMTADQRFASERPDVLTYETQPLKQSLHLAGPITVDLRTSTTGTDSDWVVKLIDVYPDDTKDPTPNLASIKMGGYQQLVRGDLMRAKFRDGLDKQVPTTPNQITPIPFTMPDINHTFQPGHRLMIQVQSSWFPLFDRNPQTFCDIYHARPEDYRKATQRLYHTPDNASRLSVHVLP